MSQPPAGAAPVVSLQARDADDYDRGHLATGLLVERNVVFVPSPPAQLLDLTGRFEVLIFPPTPRSGDPLIERIAPAGLTVPYSEVTDRPPLGATIRLSRPSHNTLSIRRELGRPAVTGPALARKLADGQDLWTALSELRAISPTLRRAPSKAVWKRLRDAERDAADDTEPELEVEGEAVDGESGDGAGDAGGSGPRRAGAGGSRARQRSNARHHAAAGVHPLAAMQAMGFNACWLVPWWCDNDD